MRIAIFSRYASAFLVAAVAACVAAGSTPVERNPKFLNESTARIDKFDGVLVDGTAPNAAEIAQAFAAVNIPVVISPAETDAPSQDGQSAVASLIELIKAGESPAAEAETDGSSGGPPIGDPPPDEPPGKVLSADDVAAMDYNTVRSLAKKCLVPAGGSRDDIAARLVGVTVPAAPAAPVE